MNRNSHILASIAAGTYTYIASRKKTGNKPSVLGTLGAVAIGAFSGALPDIIEPATSYNHRRFFHSYAIVLGGGHLICRVLKKDNVNDNLKMATRVFAAGYASHLGLDFTTTKGLPLL